VKGIVVDNFAGGGGASTGIGRKPHWRVEEIAILRTVYVEHGLEAALSQLPDRARQSIYVKANRLGLVSKHRPVRVGFYRKVAIKALELRQAGLGYAAIGRELGMCEAAATNAVLHGECLAAGHRPIERDSNGKVTEAGIERIRLMLRKGLKHRDIQVYCGVSAATITRERRRYEAYLKANGKAPLPPPGGGVRYSGAAITKDQRRLVEQLYMEGFGAAKISARSGVSRTHCLRIRDKLIRRLKRKGERLPGCDRDGRRRVHKDSARMIPPESVERLKTLLLEGVPVRRAAKIAVIGGSSAYRIRDALKAELASQGLPLPAADWRSGRNRRQLMAEARVQEVPGGARGIYRFRELCRTMAPEQARAELEREQAAERKARGEASRARTFEERLAAVAAGDAKIVVEPEFIRRGPDRTLGGVATGQL